MREYIHHQIVNTFFSDDNYKPYNTEERFIATLKYPSGYGLQETKIKIVNQTTTANEVISKALRKHLLWLSFGLKTLGKTCVFQAKIELKREKDTLNLYKIGVGGLRR